MKITFGLILGWILSVILLLASLGGLFTVGSGELNVTASILSSIIFLILGLILLPPFDNYLKSQRDINLSKGAKIGLFVVGFVIIGILTSNAEGATNEKNAEKVQCADGTFVSSQDQCPSVDNAVQEKTPAVDENSDTEPKQTVYSMNEKVELDYLTYEVKKAETFTKMGSSMMDKETDGKFVKVYLKITNNAKETKDMFSPRFSLVDSQDREYERLSDDIVYIADALEFGAQLQPGLSKSGAIVFELPTDSSDLVLQIEGDWLSTSKVMVSIDNIQDIGQDTTLEDEINEDMEETMNKCTPPFKCVDDCDDYAIVGVKDCEAGKICCMV